MRSNTKKTEENRKKNNGFIVVCKEDFISGTKYAEKITDSKEILEIRCISIEQFDINLYNRNKKC